MTMIYLEFERGFHERKPVFTAGELLLPDGHAPNKYSLQKLCGEHGLPVPNILTLAEARVRLAQAPELLIEGRNYSSEVFFRGYYDDMVDGLAVDTVETRLLENIERLEFISSTESENSTLVTNFLWKNFHKHPPTKRFFYQESVGESTYHSIWGRNGIDYFSTVFSDGPGGSRYYSCDSTTDLMSRPDNTTTHDPATLELLAMIQQLSRSANRVISDALKTPIECKHDFITDSNDKLWLIQSRVVSRPTNNETSENEIQQMHKLRAARVKEITVEPSSFESLDTYSLSNQPYILKLKNDYHGAASTRQQILRIDCRNMVGLVLPAGLRGGLLQHNCFTVIAIALYWGIPIVFE